MTPSNFHFLRFAQKGHFQGVKFFLIDGQTDGPTNLLIEAPFPELKNGPNIDQHVTCIAFKIHSEFPKMFILNVFSKNSEASTVEICKRSG